MKTYLKILRLVNRLDPFAIVITLIHTITNSILPLMILWVSGTIINGVATNIPFSTLQTTVYYLLLSLGIVYILNAIFKKLANDHNEYVFYKLQTSLIEKSMRMNFESLESPENRLMFKKAEEGSNYSGGIFTIMTHSLAAIIDVFISLLVAGASILFLTTATTSEIGFLANFANSSLFSILIIILLVLPLYTSYKVHVRANDLQLKSFEDIAYVNREMGYFYSTLFLDIEAGKTIRLYNAAPMILDVLANGTDYFISKLRDNSLKVNNIQSIGTFSTLLATACLYILLALKTQAGAITVGHVVVIGGALQSITNTLFKSITKLTQANNIVDFFKYYLQYLELPESDVVTTTSPSLGMEIEFDNVSFTYPGSNSKALSNISFVIKDGERISLVGRNGSGKTTMVKLLTRLYKPTDGKILMNGVDIQTMELGDVMSNLSIVFQDFSLYPFSIKDNIVLSGKYDENRMNEALKTTEMHTKVHSLSCGINTVLKSDYNDGINLSGGEAQKLAIARAWYKNSPMIILDEPTAALDPMSEFQIYSHFNDLIHKRTAIYISHRMSSSQFSDRIIVFDQGVVIEKGTHSELMKVDDGIYRTLFETQSQYYQ